MAAFAPSTFTPGAPRAPCTRSRLTRPRHAPTAHLQHTPPPAHVAAVDLRNLLPTPRLLPPPAAAPAPAAPPSSFVTAAVKAVGPAVVRIDTEKRVAGGAVPPGLEGLFQDPGMRKFFGEEFGNQMGSGRKRTERSLGSGFIVSSEGIIVTNSHVVKGADKITITLTDGRTFKGVLSGTDDLLDLAVVKIDPRLPTSEIGAGESAPEPRESGIPGLSGLQRFGSFNNTTPAPRKAAAPLPVAKLGSSAELSVGDWAIAVGNPHGLNNTVTLGIVSSLNRSAAEVGIPEKRMSLIQTSAPLNAGNSGGVIANDKGEVVGVAVAVRANAEGIGFAIPIDRVKDVVAELANGKTIAHPFLGIKMLTLTPDYARENNNNPNSPAVIPEVSGAIIVHVIPDSPAAKAPGLRRFDIIVGIDGKPCRGVKDVQASVEGAGVGKRIAIEVIRGGDKSKPIDVVVETGDLASANVEPMPTIIPIPVDPRL